MGSLYTNKPSYKTNPIYKSMLIYSSKSYINPIASQYFDKVAALGGNVQNKSGVNNFTIGLSRIVDPNLWACWPLRSSQSVGSGTTAPSLGLLGNFPGTLVNSPTWGVDWMSFVPANSYLVQTSLPTSFNQFSLFCSANTTNASSVFGIIGCEAIPTVASNSTYVSTTVGGNNAHLVYGNGSILQGVTPRLSTGPRIFGVTTQGNGGNIIAYQDATQLSSSSQGTANPNLENFTVGARPLNKTTSQNVESSFCAVFGLPLTQTQYLQIRDLYKNTLGQGLSLP